MGRCSVASFEKPSSLHQLAWFKKPWLKWTSFEIGPRAASLMHARLILQRQTKWPWNTSRCLSHPPAQTAEWRRPICFGHSPRLCSRLPALPCCHLSHVLLGVVVVVVAVLLWMNVLPLSPRNAAPSFSTPRLQRLSQRKSDFLPSNRSSRSSFPWDNSNCKLKHETDERAAAARCTAASGGIVFHVTPLDLFSYPQQNPNCHVSVLLDLTAEILLLGFHNHNFESVHSKQQYINYSVYLIPSTCSQVIWVSVSPKFKTMPGRILIISKMW